MSVCAVILSATKDPHSELVCAVILSEAKDLNSQSVLNLVITPHSHEPPSRTDSSSHSVSIFQRLREDSDDLSGHGFSRAESHAESTRL